MLYCTLCRASFSSAASQLAAAWFLWSREPYGACFGPELEFLSTHSLIEQPFVAFPCFLSIAAGRKLSRVMVSVRAVVQHRRRFWGVKNKRSGARPLERGLFSVATCPAEPVSFVVSYPSVEFVFHRLS
jgi:hypothetical protein